MTASIFMVSGNDITPGNETIFGFYPTLELAEKRKAAIEADPNWFTEDNESDLQLSISEIKAVGPMGVDTVMTLR